MFFLVILTSPTLGFPPKYYELGTHERATYILQVSISSFLFNGIFQRSGSQLSDSMAFWSLKKKKSFLKKNKNPPGANSQLVNTTYWGGEGPIGRGVKYLRCFFYHKALSQELGDSHSLTLKPTLSGTFRTHPLPSAITSLP